MKEKIYFHFIQILLGIDQLLNTLTGGWSDETLSSRCYRKRNEKFFGFLRVIINGIFFWQENHCKMAYEVELKRLHWPREMRNK